MYDYELYRLNIACYCTLKMVANHFRTFFLTDRNKVSIASSKNVEKQNTKRNPYHVSWQCKTKGKHFEAYNSGQTCLCLVFGLILSIFQLTWITFHNQNRNDFLVYYSRMILKPVLLSYHSMRFLEYLTVTLLFKSKVKCIVLSHNLHLLSPTLS